MRAILKRIVQQKLLAIHRSFEKEIRCRSRLCLGRTLKALDEMQELMIQRSSWEEFVATVNRIVRPSHA